MIIFLKNEVWRSFDVFRQSMYIKKIKSEGAVKYYYMG